MKIQFFAEGLFSSGYLNGNKSSKLNKNGERFVNKNRTFLTQTFTVLVPGNRWKQGIVVDPFWWEPGVSADKCKEM